MDNPVNFQAEKQLVLEYLSALDDADHTNVMQIIDRFFSPQCRFEGVYPFNVLSGPGEIASHVWQPLLSSFTNLQRRQDIFIAGNGDADTGIWVMSMGHLMGLFERPWLGIQPTRRVSMLRYAEFFKVADGYITETGFFIDIIDVMRQAGVYPLPPPMGEHMTVPGPRGNHGQLFQPSDPAEAELTMTLIMDMVSDLVHLNESGNDHCSYDFLARCWADDMAWYGPCGIGSTFTIGRYQAQHQLPFRTGLTDKVFNGHRARIAEGDFAGWYGWPNLSNKPTGGFLGMPGGMPADMRVVDVYRREGNKLVENWVIIDLLWWLKQQGLDVLERNRQLHNPSGAA